MTKEQKDAARRAHDLRILSPYLMGRALRRWYARKLIEHYLVSAASELRKSQEHQEAADYFCEMATAAQIELISLGEE